MLALLSSPVRRWLLVSLLVPLLVAVLRGLGRLVQRRHDDRPTKTSRLLLKASAALERLTKRGAQPEHEDATPARRTA